MACSGGRWRALEKLSNPGGSALRAGAVHRSRTPSHHIHRLGFSRRRGDRQRVTTSGSASWLRFRSRDHTREPEPGIPHEQLETRYLCEAFADRSERPRARPALSLWLAELSHPNVQATTPSSITLRVPEQADTVSLTSHASRDDLPLRARSRSMRKSIGTGGLPGDLDRGVVLGPRFIMMTTVYK